MARGTSGAHPAEPDRRRGSHGFLFVLGLLFVAVGAWFLLPSIQETKDLEHGVSTIGTLLEEPADCVGGCRVRFDAAGTSVVAELPAHELIKKFHAGSSLNIRYLPEHPQRIALQDTLGLGPVVLGSLIPFFGLVLITTAVAGWVRRSGR